MMRLSILLIGGAAGLLQGNRMESKNLMQQMMGNFDATKMQGHMDKFLADIQGLESLSQEEGVKEQLEAAAKKMMDKLASATSKDGKMEEFANMDLKELGVPEAVEEKLTNMKGDLKDVLGDMQELLKEAAQEVDLKDVMQKNDGKDLPEKVTKFVEVIAKKLNQGKESKDKINVDEVKGMMQQFMSKAEEMKEKLTKKAQECQAQQTECKEGDEECTQNAMFEQAQCMLGDLLQGEGGPAADVMKNLFQNIFPGEEQKQQVREAMSQQDDLFRGDLVHDEEEEVEEPKKDATTFDDFQSLHDSDDDYESFENLEQNAVNQAEAIRVGEY